MTPDCTLSLHSPSPEVTARLAAALGAWVRAGDVVLLSGPVGAGKSHFARALIQSRLAGLGRWEDVPSPTFTLVQSYDLGDVEIWHADLYRLSDPYEIVELGLEQAFETAICLVEWPERLGTATPARALHVTLHQAEGPEARLLEFAGFGPDWAGALAALAKAGADDVSG
jgi:tRNA threonylcarbamoyladenosine biosynthesis protein TsaE